MPAPGRPIVPSLLERISLHSPEIAVLAHRYFKEIGQPIEARLHFDGTDASAKLAIGTLEAMISLEQLRMELVDELASGSAPSSHLMAMNETLRMEAVLITAAKLAIDMHGAIWEANLFGAVYRDPAEQLSVQSVKEEEPSVVPVERVRRRKKKKSD